MIVNYGLRSEISVLAALGLDLEEAKEEEGSGGECQWKKKLGEGSREEEGCEDSEEYQEDS